MEKEHHYQTKIIWTGNAGVGTTSYQSYQRSHQIKIENKAIILGSSDPSFRGDPSKHNPEDLFLSAISSCHMLWYLHLCAVNGVVVLEYTDIATGILIEGENIAGHFKEVQLNPNVIVSSTQMIQKAMDLHKEANKSCFIANSCNFPISHHPTCAVSLTF